MSRGDREGRRTIDDGVPARFRAPRWLARYIAGLVSVACPSGSRRALAIAYPVDVLAVFGLIPWTPWVGYTITGIIIVAVSLVTAPPSRRQRATLDAIRRPGGPPFVQEGES